MSRARDPFRPARRRAGRRLAGLVAVVVLLAFYAAGRLDRASQRRVELGAPASVLVENRAGPVEIAEGGEVVVVEATASHLRATPRVEATPGRERAVVRASCPGRWPCRIALRVSVPAGTAVEVAVADDPVAVGPFTGALAVAAAGGAVSLGPVSGPLTVEAGSGPVRATDLRSQQVAVAAGSGPVELVATRVPRSLTVTGRSAPVHLTVPPAAYRLRLEGQPVEGAAVVHAAGAPAALSVRSGGPVTVATTPGRAGCGPGAGPVATAGCGGRPVPSDRR